MSSVNQNDDLFAAIYEKASHRRRILKSRNRLNSQCRALVIAHLNDTGTPFTYLPEEARGKLIKQASTVIDSIDRRELPAKKLREVYLSTEYEVRAYLSAKLTLDEQIHRLDKSIASFIKEWLSVDMPTLKRFMDEPHGFASGLLSQVIAHAGPLHNYDNPAKLWKRMGLGILEGKIQKDLARKGITEERAREIGYHPERRAVMHVIGVGLLKAKGSYHQRYVDRKPFEKQKEDVKTDLHAHNRALRYIEKKLLKDLWVAWVLDVYPEVVEDYLQKAQAAE